MKAVAADLRRLRRLWDEHRHQPFPGGPARDPGLQEIALYASWVGGMVEWVLGKGHLDREHAQLLEARRAEGNQGVFRATGDLGEPARGFVARLMAMEEILAGLPVEP